MKLDKKIVRSFTKAINRDEKKKSSGYNVEGTVVGDNLVQLVGSSELTVVEMSVDAKTGDRVLVHIEDRVATVVGNFTAPPGVSVADLYVQLVPDEESPIGQAGLLIKNNSNDGVYALLSDDVFYLFNDMVHTEIRANGYAVLWNTNEEFVILLGKIGTTNLNYIMLSGTNIGLKAEQNNSTSSGEVLCVSDISPFGGNMTGGGVQIRAKGDNNGTPEETNLLMTKDSVVATANHFKFGTDNENLFNAVNTSRLYHTFSFVEIGTIGPWYPAGYAVINATGATLVSFELRSNIELFDGGRQRIPIGVYTLRTSNPGLCFPSTYNFVKRGDKYYFDVYITNVSGAAQNITVAAVISMVYIDDVAGPEVHYPNIDFNTI